MADRSDVEKRDREDNTVGVGDVITQEQSVLSQNSPDGADNQLATAGSSVNVVNVVGNEGTTQLGENSVVYHSCTILQGQHVHHHHHFNHPPPTDIQNTPPYPRHDNSSLNHGPCQCELCIRYHGNNHPPLAEHHPPPPKPAPRQLELPAPVPQLPAPNSLHTEQMERSENVAPGSNRQNPYSRLIQNNHGQRSSDSQRQRSSDVTNHMTQEQLREQTRQKEKATEQTIASNAIVADRRTEKSHPTREGTNSLLKEQIRNGRSLDSQQGKRREENIADRKLEKFKTTREVETRSIENVAETIEIFDSNGGQLTPGDIVCISNCYYAIYVGDMDVVWCRGAGRRVKKEKLTMTEPFRKLTITRGLWKIFPPRERVVRAESCVGKMIFTNGYGMLLGFLEVLWDGDLNFVVWVSTGRPRSLVEDQTAGTMSTCRTHTQQHCLL